MIAINGVEPSQEIYNSYYYKRYEAKEDKIKELFIKWKEIVPSEINYEFLKSVFFQCKVNSKKNFQNSPEKIFPIVYLATCKRFGIYFSLSILNLIPASRQFFNKIFSLTDFVKRDYFQLVMGWVMKIAEEAQNQRPNKPILATLHQYLKAAELHQKKVPLKQIPHRPLTVAIVFLQAILETNRIYVTYSKILQILKVSPLHSIKPTVKKKIMRHIWNYR